MVRLAAQRIPVRETSVVGVEDPLNATWSYPWRVDPCGVITVERACADEPRLREVMKWYAGGHRYVRCELMVCTQPAGLPRIQFHGLRHTAATLLLEAGMHPRVVAERLGHTTPVLVLNVYGHVTERMQEQVTAALERSRRMSVVATLGSREALRMGGGGVRCRDSRGRLLPAGDVVRCARWSGHDSRHGHPRIWSGGARGRRSHPALTTRVATFAATFPRRADASE